MVVVLPKEKIAYFPIRKVATTTIKDALRQNFSGGDELWESYGLPMSPLVRWHARGCYRFAVVRDPVKRFLSMYGNIVAHHNEFSFPWYDRVAAKLAGVSTRPDIEYFVRYFRTYFFLNDKIRRHSQLQIRALGKNLDYFHAIYPISELT